MARALLGPISLAAALSLAVSAAFAQTAPQFRRVHIFSAPAGATAEIAAADRAGRLLAYTNSNGSLGFLDIRPLPAAAPIELASLPVDGEPTSVVVTPDARFVVAVVRGGAAGNRALVIRFADALAGAPSEVASIPLPGEPDSIAVAEGGAHFAIAIENEATPALPGELTIIDAIDRADPATWTTRSVALTAIAGLNASDPEPEYVAIRGRVAAVTLQENNHVALVDLAAGVVIGHFSAGSVTHRADVTADRNAVFSGSIADSPRIPDGIAWTRRGQLVTANEGEANLTGGRGVTTFDTLGNVLFDSAEQLEVAASGAGLYPDARSNRKGIEVENVAVATFGRSELAFVASERGNFVSVHRVAANGELPLLQLLPLPNGAEPEGVLPIPARGLVVSANEGDGTIAFWARGGRSLDITAAVDPASANGDPIWWSALSGFSAGAEAVVHAVPDSAVAPSRIFTLDTSRRPAVVASATTVTSAGLPASFDLEGIAVRRTAGNEPDVALGYWAVSEGNAGSLADQLIELDANAAVVRTVQLPPAVKAQALRWGFEGVAVTRSGASEQVYVAFQREWLDDPLGFVRIGRFTPATDEWAFFHYPLDFASSGTSALETGLSDLVAVDDETFLVIERDSLKGANALLKRVYAFSIAGIAPTPCDATAVACPVGAASLVWAKALVRDLVALDGLTLEKVEGLAIRSADGALLVGTDNDGVGETRLIRAE
jgi:DNA-binding beta-propeller fold protein YncE